MKSQFLIASIILTSCGPDQTKGNQNGAMDPYSGQPQMTVENGPEKPKEVITEYRKEGSEMALVLDSSSDLPECGNGNDRQLVYLKDQKIFMTCDDDRWLEVTIKGEKGDQGPAGTDGGTGAQGATGAQGPQGQKGEDGKPLAANEWLDPITNNRWLIGGVANWAYVSGQYVAPACDGDYRSPTIEEARAVVLHGIGPKLTPYGFVWTTHRSTEFPTTLATAIEINGASERDKPMGTPLDIICLYSPQL
jgi:hypothetical protein